MIHGRVYKIYCNITGECYYGSTEQTLSRRLSKHKQDYKYWKEGQSKYVYSFKIIERGNFTISLLEENDFENKDYMKARERHYIENCECVNKNVPNRTDKEYREANKERIKERREANKERITEQIKEYYEANKEQIAEYHKEYHQANRQQLLEKKKEKYEKNKEAILEKQKKKFTCDCGSVCRIGDKARHEKSKKHLAYIEQK